MKNSSNIGNRNLLVATALLLLAVFFSFFGNGASANPSLFSWVYGSCVGDSMWVLISLTAITAHLLISKKSRHKILAGRVSAAGSLLLYSCTVTLAVVAFVIGNTVLSYISFIALVFSIVISFYGRGAYVYSLFVLFGLFSLPHSPLSAFTPQFQACASFVSKLGLSWLGIDFDSHGASIMVDGFGCRIAEECSGLRSMQLSTEIAILIAAFYPIKWMGKLLLIALSFALGAISNIIRIFVVIGFGIWRGGEFSITVGHDLVGPAIGILILLIFFYFAPEVMVRHFPQKEKSCSEKRVLRFVPAQFLSLLLLLAIGSAICIFAGGEKTPKSATMEGKFPGMDRIGGWERTAGVFCTGSNCLFSFSAQMPPITGMGSICIMSNDAELRKSSYSLEENADENLQVYRAIYTSKQHQSGIKLAAATGGRAGLHVCNPFWHLYISGVSIESRRTVSLTVGDEEVDVVAVDFKFPYIKNGKPVRASGFYWLTNGNRVYSSHLRMDADFSGFGRERVTCFAYCEQGEDNKKELTEFVRQLLSEDLQIPPPTHQLR